MFGPEHRSSQQIPVTLVQEPFDDFTLIAPDIPLDIRFRHVGNVNQPATAEIHRSSPQILARQDGTSTLRPEVAQGKARGAISLGLGSRAIFKRAQEQPFFIQAINGLAGGSLVPVPGGVLLRDAQGDIVGAVGVTGDTSDNDEACAVAGIEAAGYVADPG